MNSKAQFIKDRAGTLLYEARQFPDTARMALSWLTRAMAWAEKNQVKWLFDYLHCTVMMIFLKQMQLCLKAA